jgi:4-hydroxymandelate oxidase
MTAAASTTRPLALRDYESLAHDLLDGPTWDYFAGGSADEVTLRANSDAFGRIRLRPRVLPEGDPVSTATSVLGTPIELPVLVAPTAYHGLVHPDGECATAAGAGTAGTVVVVSINSNRTLEEVAAAATRPVWLQLYLTGDHAADEEIVRRAEAAGFGALVLTVDRPVYGAREKDVRNGFRLPAHLRAANYDGTRDLRATAWTSWAALDWLIATTRLPVVVKGILTGEDAAIAVEHGVAAVIVSNHGGRQLDGSIAGIEALPEVAAAVDRRCEVYCDGGVRRGTDVLKALALGARAVLLGRPIVWGLALDGVAGVAAVLELLRAELERDLTLSGRRKVSDVDRSLVTSIPSLS